MDAPPGDRTRVTDLANQYTDHFIPANFFSKIYTSSAFKIIISYSIIYQEIKILLILSMYYTF